MPGTVLGTEKTKCLLKWVPCFALEVVCLEMSMKTTNSSAVGKVLYEIEKVYLATPRKVLILLEERIVREASHRKCYLSRVLKDDWKDC